MAVPPFLSGNIAFQAPGAVSDVQDIIDDFATLALALTPAWTDGGGGLYTSPVDGDGRFFDVLLTRIGATNLEMRVRDDVGTTIITRRMQIVAGPQDFWISLSAFHMWLEITNATEESMGAGLLDLSPDAQTAHSTYVWARASRSAADALDSLGNSTGDIFMIDNGSPANAGRALAKNLNQDITVVATVTGGGSNLWQSLDFAANFAGNWRYAGRCYNILFTTIQGTFTVPIGDAAETASFKSTDQLDINGLRLAFRVG